MKTPLIVAAGFVILLNCCGPKAPVSGQKPLSPGAGRGLELQELLEFESRFGKSSFRLNDPQPMQVDSRGSLYVLDQDRLLKFSPDGRFAWDLPKVDRPASRYDLPENDVSFVIWQDEPYVCNGVNKITRLDANGRPVGEVPLSGSGLRRILAMCEQGCVVFTRTLPDPDGPDGISDQTFRVECLSLDGTVTKKILELPVRVHKEPFRGKSSILPESQFVSVFDRVGKVLYLNYTDEFQVVKVDLAQMRIVDAFTRDVPRVKSPPSRIPEFSRDYRPAIVRMYVSDRNLWVRTYRRDEVKGSMFDVFDPRGRFVDSFYMPSIQSSVCLPSGGGLFYNIVPSVGGEIVARKYRILNGPKPSRRS